MSVKIQNKINYMKPLTAFLMWTFPPLIPFFAITYIISGLVLETLVGTIFFGLVWAFFVNYLSYSPRTSMFWGKVHYKGNPEKKQISLTFADGPEPSHTPGILKVLKEKNISATFFLVGENAEKYPELVKQIIREGHEIGNHSYSHADLSWKKSDLIETELVKTQNILRSITGASPELFRPPLGRRDFRVINLAKQMGLKTIQWHIDTEEWHDLGIDETVKGIERNVTPGSIIQFHECKKNGNPLNVKDSAALINQIIDRITARCYTIVPAGEIIK